MNHKSTKWPTPQNHKTLLGQTIGFEDIIGLLNTRPSTYPPYNLIKHSSSGWLLEIAVAGFDEDEIDVELIPKERFLCVTGSKVESDDPESFIHHGLATRDFHLRFVLGEHIEVDHVQLKAGILKIYLTKVIPEHIQPVKFEISSEPRCVKERQILMENSEIDGSKIEASGTDGSKIDD